MDILVVEDESRIANALKKNLLAEGHSAIIAEDGERALALISEIEFSAVLLDWRIPKITGIEVCKRVRESGNEIPIILLTALDDIKNKVDALNAGADDYITKPFSFEEVVARISAVVRRVNLVSKDIDFDRCSLNLLTRTLSSPKEKINLPEKEFELLKYFLQNRGKIISKIELSENVWKLSYDPGSNVVEATVKNLRKKLENQTETKYIKTAYGEGYIFIPD